MCAVRGAGAEQRCGTVCVSEVDVFGCSLCSELCAVGAPRAWRCWMNVRVFWIPAGQGFRMEKGPVPGTSGSASVLLCSEGASSAL